MIDGETVKLGMSAIIEIVMLSAAALILLLTRTDGMKATQGSVFPAGMQAVIAIFGIAWMGDTFLQGNVLQLTQSIEGVVRQMPWLFGIALFVMSILLYSQAATVRALMPLGIALGISPLVLIALFPAVNGYFFIPNYPTVIAAINFRPYRNNPHRQVCTESFVHAARTYFDWGCHRAGIVLYQDVLTETDSFEGNPSVIL